jgi:hypothetical protein
VPLFTTKMKFSKETVLAATLFSLIVLSVPASGSKGICEAGVRNAAPASVSSSSISQVESWNKHQRILIVVDGLSDGAGYVTQCRQMFPDVKVVHIQSSMKLPADLVSDFFKAENYDASFVYDGQNLATLKRLFQRFDKAGLRVLAGTETGVAVTDLLSSALGTLSNGVSKSAARTDKELLAANVQPLIKDEPMLRIIPGKSFVEAADATAFLQQQDWKYPLALKPTGSAGNYGFRFIHDIEHVPGVFSELVGSVDPLGNKIHRLLIQPRLSGVVVAMNTTLHPELGIYLTDMWRTHVRFTNTGVVFLRTRIAPFDPASSEHQQLMKAARYTAKGLDISFGPLHPEYLVTPEGYIYLMDAGARPAGGSLPVRARECGAVDQIRATLIAAFDPAGFAELVRKGPQLKKELAILYFVADRAGVLASIPSEDEMRARIPGYVSRDVEHMKVGKRLEISHSLFNQPGFVVVEGDSAVIDAAEAAIRDWESKDFYKFN